MNLMNIIWNRRGDAKIFVIAAIFAILLAIIVVIRSQKEDQEEKIKAEEEASLVADFKSDDIYSIEIYELLQKTVLQKQNGQWYVGMAQIYPSDSQDTKEKKPITGWDRADEDAIREVLETVKTGLTGKELVSTNREKKIQFRTGILSSKYMFKNEKGESIACIEIGEQSSDFSGTFVSLCGKDEIYKIPGLLNAIFKKDPNGWRSRQVFDLDKTKITKIEAAGAKLTAPVSAAKGTDGKWTGITPSAFPVDDASLDAILTKISTYKAEGFPQRMDPNDTLKIIDLEITMTMEDGSAHKLTFGNAERSPEKLVKSGDSGIIYAANPNDVDELTKQFQGLVTGTSSTETSGITSDEKAAGAAAPAKPGSQTPIKPPTPVPNKPPKKPSGK